MKDRGCPRLRPEGLDLCDDCTRELVERATQNEDATVAQSKGSGLGQAVLGAVLSGVINVLGHELFNHWDEVCAFLKAVVMASGKIILLSGRGEELPDRTRVMVHRYPVGTDTIIVEADGSHEEKLIASGETWAKYLKSRQPPD